MVPVCELEERQRQGTTVVREVDGSARGDDEVRLDVYELEGAAIGSLGDRGPPARHALLAFADFARMRMFTSSTTRLNAIAKYT